MIIALLAKFCEDDGDDDEDDDDDDDDTYLFVKELWSKLGKYISSVYTDSLIYIVWFEIPGWFLSNHVI